MLQRLQIQNYAIIDEVEIEFPAGLTIITGETGAGKSILMGALALILGERADVSALRHTGKKCFIEGHFGVAGNRAVESWLRANDLDPDEQLVLRRDIAATGKSRAFINDTPATLQQLRELASLLVDLHRQFDTLELGDAAFQRTVIDALAGHEEQLLQYRSLYLQWQQSLKTLRQLEEQKTSFRKEADYNQFLYDELQQLALQENELENLEKELKLLTGAEGIKAALERVHLALKESEQPVVSLLKQLHNQLTGYAAHHEKIPPLLERLRAAQVELDDLADEASYTADAIQYDEKRVFEINEKLNLGYKLLKKHGVQRTAELLAIQAELEQKLQTALHVDEEIEALQKQCAALEKQALALASLLSAQRQKQVAPFESAVNRLLQQVGMPNARLKVDLHQTHLHAEGNDEVRFLFDANKSGRFEPIEKVASGGELSRLMLCIKSLVAESVELPTMIFDEIDTGISGEAARQVGIIMKKLASRRQIICITHQPQIAGKADTHLYVYKEMTQGALHTGIRRLEAEERVTSIARMLSGEKPTAAALENAREMMQ